MNDTKEILIDREIVENITYEIFKYEKENITTKVKREDMVEEIRKIVQGEIDGNFKEID